MKMNIADITHAAERVITDVSGPEGCGFALGFWGLGLIGPERVVVVRGLVRAQAPRPSSAGRSRVLLGARLNLGLKPSHLT